MRHLLLLLAAGSVLSGCGGVYGPLRESDTKPYEASYDLVADGASFGSARVVAGGAEEGVVGGESRVILPVSVLVDNAADDEVAVGAHAVMIAYVETSDGGRVSGDAIEVVRRKAAVVEDGVARVEAAFAMPAGYTVKDVASFGVRWGVERNGTFYNETTKFALPSPNALPVVLVPGGTTYEEFYGGYHAQPYGFDAYHPIAPPAPARVPAHPTTH